MRIMNGLIPPLSAMYRPVLNNWPQCSSRGFWIPRIRLEESALDSKADAVPVGVMQECHETEELLDSVRKSVLDTGEYTRMQENIEARRAELLATADQYGKALVGECYE